MTCVRGAGIRVNVRTPRVVSTDRASTDSLSCSQRMWQAAPGSSFSVMNESNLNQGAEGEANEAQRPLVDRLASINPILRPGVQATVALYYAILSQRSSYIGHP